MSFRQQRVTAVTLIELIVVTGIFALVLGILTSVMWSSVSSQKSLDDSVSRETEFELGRQRIQELVERSRLVAPVDLSQPSDVLGLIPHQRDDSQAVVVDARGVPIAGPLAELTLSVEGLLLFTQEADSRVLARLGKESAFEVERTSEYLLRFRLQGHSEKSGARSVVFFSGLPKLPN